MVGGWTAKLLAHKCTLGVDMLIQYIYTIRDSFYTQVLLLKSMRGHIQSYVFCMDSLTLSYNMLYTLLCNMHTLKVLESRDCNDHRHSCNCTFEVP